ncbi:MAG: hemerythrin domain-containing protein [Propionivibrio sp.]
MKPSSWTSELETGLSTLDDDHQQLLARADRLKQASTNANFSELKSALLDMKTETVAHFAREEALMRDCKYEGMQEHWDEHQRLLAEVQGEIDALEAFEKSVATFGNLIHQWMFQHIAGKDTLFGRAVISQVGTTDRRREDDENFDAFEERRMNNLEAIRWPTDVSTGIESIDTHYPAMIDLLNRIIVARKSSDRQLLASLIEQFGNATESHFREEEAMMSTIDFEHGSKHREEHRLLLDEFSDLVDDWRSDRISAELLCRFIYRWMLNHIAASDIPLGAAISRQTA